MWASTANSPITPAIDTYFEFFQLSLANMASEPSKRMKILDSPFLWNSVSSDRKNDTVAATSSNVSMVAAQTSGTNIAVQQAKHLALAQAQQDGCTGNYKIFDSPFGNFLLPVVPTHAELSQ